MPISFNDDRTIYSVAYGSLMTMLSQSSIGIHYDKPFRFPIVFIPMTIVGYAYCTCMGIGINQTKQK